MKNVLSLLSYPHLAADWSPSAQVRFKDTGAKLEGKRLRLHPLLCDQYINGGLSLVCPVAITVLGMFSLTISPLWFFLISLIVGLAPIQASCSGVKCFPSAPNIFLTGGFVVTDTSLDHCDSAVSCLLWFWSWMDVVAVVHWKKEELQYAGFVG